MIKGRSRRGDLAFGGPKNDPLLGGGKKGKGAGTDIQSAGSTLYNRTKMTDEESSQYKGSFDIGSFLKQLFGAQAGMNAAPAGAVSPDQAYQNQGDLEKGLYSQTLKDVNNPYGSYESALQPALTQAQDTINSYYQKRGLINSGLAIEGMGRAGVDLAIQEAQGKMNARQQAMSNATTLGNNIYSQYNSNIGNLAGLYNNQQFYGLQGMNRQAGGAQGAAGYQAYPAQAALGSYYGGQAALQALPGQIIGAAGKVATAGA